MAVEVDKFRLLLGWLITSLRYATIESSGRRTAWLSCKANRASSFNSSSHVSLMGGSPCCSSKTMGSHGDFVASSGPSPTSAEFNLGGGCQGPDRVSRFQLGVLHAKVRELGVISVSFGSCCKMYFDAYPIEEVFFFERTRTLY